MKDLSYRIVQGKAVRTKTKMLRDSDFAEEPPGEPRVAGVAAAPGQDGHVAQATAGQARDEQWQQPQETRAKQDSKGMARTTSRANKQLEP